MDYFEIAKNLTASHAVRDAVVTKTAAAYMAQADYREDCIADVLKCHDQSDLAFLLQKLIFGGPSAKAEARLEFVNLVETAAMNYARSQQ
jgi:hypothetical protein